MFLKIGLENQLLVFLRVAVLDRFYCTYVLMIGICCTEFDATSWTV